MEKLIICSRVLYDNDISDKMDEITSLKKKLRFYETPTAEYSGYEEWETKKEEAYQIIKNGLTKWIVDDTFEYEFMAQMGLTPRQRNAIPYYIEQALNLITKENNKEWVEKISDDIVYGIAGSINGIIEVGIWDVMTPENMLNFIYNNIIWQLGDDSHSPCIVDDIAIYTCKLCGKTDPYVPGENICFDCQGI